MDFFGTVLLGISLNELHNQVHEPVKLRRARRLRSREAMMIRVVGVSIVGELDSCAPQAGVLCGLGEEEAALGTAAGSRSTRTTTRCCKLYENASPEEATASMVRASMSRVGP